LAGNRRLFLEEGLSAEGTKGVDTINGGPSSTEGTRVCRPPQKPLKGNHKPIRKKEWPGYSTTGGKIRTSTQLRGAGHTTTGKRRGSQGKVGSAYAKKNTLKLTWAKRKNGDPSSTRARTVTRGSTNQADTRGASVSIPGIRWFCPPKKILRGVIPGVRTRGGNRERGD